MEFIIRLRRSMKSGALALILLASSSAGWSAEFDERVKAPELVSEAQAKKQLRDSFAKDSTMSPMERLRAGDTRWIDLQWQLNRMAQTGQPPPDLSEFGLQKRSDDGAYVLDIEKAPQWGLWFRAVADLGERSLFGAQATALLDRGFRDEDIQIVQEYIGQKHPRRAMLDAEKRIIKGAKAHRAKAPGQRLAGEDAASYAYQLERERELARQLWVAGLLERLDEQRQRILVSYFEENGGTIAFMPEANLDRSLEQFGEIFDAGMIEQNLLKREQELPQ